MPRLVVPILSPSYNGCKLASKDTTDDVNAKVCGPKASPEYKCCKNIKSKYTKIDKVTRRAVINWFGYDETEDDSEDDSENESNDWNKVDRSKKNAERKKRRNVKRKMKNGRDIQEGTAYGRSRSS